MTLQHSSITSETRVFEHRSVVKTTMEDMLAFHADAKALGILTPPPIFVQLHRDTRTSLTVGELDFTLWMGFIPVRWLARHEPGPTETSFADRMIEGPMKSWLHQHIFRAVEGGVELVDRVTLSHQKGWRGLLSRLMFDGLPLRILFWYRHLRTRLAVEK
jgi:ligand-binding SRPBCC domain-containing protein